MSGPEPLELSAPVAHAAAERLCKGCGWYHGLWQYLRYLGLIEPMGRHAAFFERELSRLKSQAGTRILVCGAADYWTYARVLAAFAGRRVAPSITVIDLCETPLLLNRWYARRERARIAARRRDVLEFNPSARFDAICTHAILGRFSPERRRDLMAKWHSLLRPGGVLVTVTPMRPGDPLEPVRFNRKQADDFVAKVERAATTQGLQPPGGVAGLVDQARTYAERFQVYRVPSREVVKNLLEDAGFRIDRLRTLPPAKARGPTGPTRAGAAYLQTVARRP
jgi:SAM-dependent methyltransferase